MKGSSKSGLILWLVPLVLVACSTGGEIPGESGSTPEDAKVVIQYDCIPNYANWGAVTALYEETHGVRVPPDMKGSSAAMAALEAEKANPQADTAYYSGAIGYEAARRGLHRPYKPAGWDQIPDGLKDPNGLWWTVHTGTIAVIVNTAALEGRPAPQSWQDLLDPIYEGLVAYDDPTWGGTAYTFVYGINALLGGSATDFEPGLDYLARLDANIHSYPRESVYNDVLRGEIPIWINADGNGYKMKWVDGGPVEVVIPTEGTFSMPLVMGLVAGAPRVTAAQRYLDWLLTPPAQAEFARAYFRPVIPGTTPREVSERFLPDSEYERVRNLPLADMAAASDALKRAWLERIRGGEGGG
jgi:putative spermidine/putrescine transport system substrate-binding protein